MASLFDRIGGRDSLLKLLKHFYADVRQHDLLGPIFNAHIRDWPRHLELIADFWSSVTGGPALYTGGMPFKHIPLSLKEEHFHAWLGLWRHHCRARLEPIDAEELISAAENIALRLRRFCGLSAPTTQPLLLNIR